MENNRVKPGISSKNALFWILQCTGWCLYYLNDLYLFTGYANYTPKSLVLFSVTFPVGFGLTVLLRYPYRHLQARLRIVALLPLYILLASVITAILWYIIDLLFSMPFWDQPTYDDWIKNLSFRTLVRRNYLHFPIILLWSAFYFGIKFWWERNEHKELAERALVLAQQARMRMLRYQLNPHFLFNSLTGIRALVLENPSKARDMIADLSEFLRYSLLPECETNTTLTQELEIISLYFDIEKTRFEEKLQVTYDIDREAGSFQLPALILQPFIENAIKYGMKTSRMPLMVHISAQITRNGILIGIRNSGTWSGDDRTTVNETCEGMGKGIENARMRLENAYPAGYSLEITKASDHVMVQILISNPSRNGVSS